jgi:aminopeptidase N
MVVALSLVGCGDNLYGVDPTTNLARDILSTELAIDLPTHSGKATITFAASETPGASLEIGDLAIESVTVDGADVPRTITSNFDLGLPASGEPIAVTITYRYALHEEADGVSSHGYTLTWPYYCFNIFPCHSDPHDGSSYKLELTGVPSDQLAVYPTELPDAPAYQVAWAIAPLEELPLGTTTNGTEVSMWHAPGQDALAQRGGARLVAAFDWLEQTLGPYEFGPKVGGVQVDWRYTDVGQIQLGGMEHHPFWHIDTPSFGSDESHIHEAIHGWYGDGIRIGCWEDMVVSEGTTTYLAGRVLEVLDPSSQYFQGLAGGLVVLPDLDRVWPQSCGVVDGNLMINNDVYIRGALFYRALANRLGAGVLDGVLAAFYAEHVLGSARLTDVLAKIEAMTGYDAMPCATTWLRTMAIPSVAQRTCP